MYESIARWQGQPQLEATLDSLFGTKEWRRIDQMGSPQEKKDFLLNLYQGQLKNAGMTYTRAFEMRDRGNRTEYYLIFATHSLKGLKAMKSAMWQVDPTGRYQFSDATRPEQLTLFQAAPDLEWLRRLILIRFAGTQARVEDVEEFVLVDTAFRETRYRRILAGLENEGRIDILTSRKRRNTYPPLTLIRFH
jgi:hypothetical protein